MFEKYVCVKESNIVVKQTSGGVWYCSELPARTTAELEVLIGEVNRILNVANSDVVVKKKSKDSKLDVVQPVTKMVKLDPIHQETKTVGLLG